MRKATLVFKHLLSLGLALAGLAAVRPAWAGAVGEVIQLPGHISEIVLDEPRASLYAANFTAGQVDVISTATNRLVSSIKTGGQPSGAALSPDGRYLVVTNYNNFGVASLSSVVAIDMNDLTRRNFAMSNPPLAVAFGADGAAIIVTTADIVRFHPGGGTFELVNTIASLADSLPVPEPRFPREITRASVSASGDGNYIFAVTDAFVFVYKVSVPRRLDVRLNSSFQRAISPPLASPAFDGSYVMVGQYLLNRQLRVMAENVDADVSDVNLGGSVVDFGVRKVYAAYVPLAATLSDARSTAEEPSFAQGSGLDMVLYVQDADNLTIRDRYVLAERATGRVLLGGGGRTLYAISDSGVLHVALAELSQEPQVRPDVEQLFVQFDFCEKTVARQTFRIENPGGVPADFDITTDLRGVTFYPSRGVAPATVEMVVDFSEYSTVQGTTHGLVTISSASAVNVALPIRLDINVKDVDQRGRIVPVPGQLVDILGDPRRDQFYVLEQTKNELHVFQNSDLRLLGTFRTGNRPNWMTFSADRRYLLIANSAGENLTVINLDSRQNEGYLFTPAGHYPVSVAADNANILAAVRTSEGTAMIDAVQLNQRAAFPMGRLGIYTNEVAADTAMVSLPNMAGIFIAEANGNVKLWDAATREVRLARQDFSGLSGAIAAGPNALVVANHILNMSLVPQASISDAPNAPAGFTFIGEQGIHTTSPGGAIVDTGSVQRVETRTPGLRVSPVRMAEAPLTPLNFSFLRSLAGLRNGTIVSTSSTGLVELPGNFDAGIAIPRVSAITSAADFTANLGQGGLVSIFGQNLAPGTAAAGTTPLPTTLANVCVTVNGFRMPLLYVSPGQINGQLPFDLQGQVSTVLHTPGGLSDIYYAQVRQAAPSVFRISVDGQSGAFPAVVRTRNNQLATLANPLRPNEIFLVYATGLGEVGPPVEPGAPGPLSPLSTTTGEPVVTVGGRSAPVIFAGLAPGFVGVYQLNVKVPADAPLGMQIPLTISAGGTSTTVNVRVVD
jgi:uncharacterized protein (TIGR03437 family)